MPQPRGPLVAFSRWAGALGDEVAARVAEWLDYGLFGAESIDRLAADPDLSARLEVGLDAAQRVAIGERVPGTSATDSTRYTSEPRSRNTPVMPACEAMPASLAFMHSNSGPDSSVRR